MPNPFEDINQLYKWCTRGSNCPICDALRGKVYSMDIWMSCGVWPGFHLNCDCYLKKVFYEPMSDLDFFGDTLFLLGHTVNPGNLLFRLHYDPNWEPYNISLSKQIIGAHMKWGSGLSIGEVLKRLRDSWIGFFKRSEIWNNFFQWRVFRTVQHYNNIDDTYSDIDFNILNYYLSHPRTGSSFTLNHRLRADTLKAYLPQQTYDNFNWRY